MIPIMLFVKPLCLWLAEKRAARQSSSYVRLHTNDSNTHGGGGGRRRFNNDFVHTSSRDEQVRISFFLFFFFVFCVREPF